MKLCLSIIFEYRMSAARWRSIEGLLSHYSLLFTYYATDFVPQVCTNDQRVVQVPLSHKSPMLEENLLWVFRSVPKAIHVLIRATPSSITHLEKKWLLVPFCGFKIDRLYMVINDDHDVFVCESVNDLVVNFQSCFSN